MEGFMEKKVIQKATIYTVLVTLVVTFSFFFALTVHAAAVNVSNNSQLASALANASPGDVIVLADGNYSGLTITTQGTASAPIEIRAANQGKAIFNSGVLYLNGANYTTLNGLKVTTSGGQMTVSGKSRYVGVYFNNSNYCRITRCTFTLTAISSSTATEWIMMSGNSNYNRIDYSEFGPWSAKGHYIYPSGEPTISGVTVPSDRSDWANYNSPYNPNMARHTQIDHNYFHDNTNTETICLGGIGVTGDYQDTYSIVENNLFVNCSGDAEIIAIKSSNNTLRYNTVRTSNGMFSSRAGNKNSIYGNFFFQGGQAGTGGIKIYEKDHKVYNNYIEGASEYPILLGCGDAYTASDFSHAQVIRATVVNNTVVNASNKPVCIGFLHSNQTSSTALPPLDSVFANNIISGDATKLIDERVPSNITYSKNIVNGTLGISASSSEFLNTNPQFVTANAMQKLSSSSPAINYADTNYTSFVASDMDGQTRSTPDTGADEYSTATIVISPLTTADVGQSAGNLALNKTATSSSQWSSSYPASKAFDGSTSTRWVSLKGTTNNEWLCVDLGKSTTFRQVVLSEYNSHVTSYKLQYSSNGTNFTDIPGATGTTIGTSGTISFSPVTARYLRLYVLTATADTNIIEMQVYN
jgi:F5/8 type C domain.